jgi:DNA-binding NtrC family response regulator
MKQYDYKFDYKYSGHMTQFVDVLSKIPDEREMMDRGFDILSKVTRYKFLMYLEKGSNGLRLPSADEKPKSKGFRSPQNTDVGRELLALVSDRLSANKRNKLIHINGIVNLSYKALASHEGLNSLVVANLINADGYEYGAIVFGCSDEKILNTFEIGLIESFQSRALELLERNKSVLREREIVWGTSNAMAEVQAVVKKVAASEANVIIRGDSGTGKELVARLIHDHSSRRSHPFVDVNCAALPETLLESELFGHEKGSFTGAIDQKIGKFEWADGGTLFLDEVGDTSLPMQVKMLRALQEGEFTRVGGNEKITSDIRVISATNQDLEGLIDRSDFRRDLFYRLNVIPIIIPPLRERVEDIHDLVNHFLRRFSRRSGIQYSFTPKAMERLMEYPWPGNVRELENIIERTITLSPNTTIDVKDLRLEPVRKTTGFQLDFHEVRPLRDVIGEIRHEYCRRAVERYLGNKSKTAAALGISRLILNKYLEDPNNDD